MPAIRTAFLAVFALASFSLARAAEGNREPARMFTLVNASDASIVSVDVDGVTVLSGAPLPGGTTDATVRLPAGDCLRDFRVTFLDGHRQTFRGIDVCRASRLRLGTWPRAGG